MSAKAQNSALWGRAKAAARAKFDVYPSAYANAWASKWYKSHGGHWSGDDNRVKKADGGGLGKWFAEDWKDIKTGKSCGRSGGEKGKRPYPACRPAHAAAEMSKVEKQTMSREKTGPERKSWSVSPSGERKGRIAS
jgi:Family of unknown function (DUF5872)